MSNLSPETHRGSSGCLAILDAHVNQLNNGLVPIDTVWREQSNDPDDTQGGAALYALSPKIKEITE